MKDATIIYYTANCLPEAFHKKTYEQLKKASSGIPIIAVSHKPMEANQNIVVDLPRHHLSIYKQALIGAKAATTRYIFLCEDDVLYSPEHFKHRSMTGKFSYNMNSWNVATWGDAVFTQKLGGRKNLSQLVCERELFIEAMEERFNAYPDESEININLWGEPSKYERQLGVTVREADTFATNPPNIIFSHQTALSFNGLGERKRLGQIRAYEIPTWGKIEEVRSYYGETN